MMVGVAVGFSVGSCVGLVVGTSVGFAVGTSVGIIVGASVGCRVGSCVGLAVGSVVGAIVGSIVGGVGVDPDRNTSTKRSNTAKAMRNVIMVFNRITRRVFCQGDRSATSTFEKLTSRRLSPSVRASA